MGTVRHQNLPLLLALLCMGLYSPVYGVERLTGHAGAIPSGAVVRERQKVMVGSQAEEWRLEWRKAPVPNCDPAGDDWYTCPYDGFAFGEQGELDLVRQVPGKPDERMHLSPLFKLGFDGEAVARLPKWPVLKGDIERKDSPGFSKMVQSRPIVRIMKVADYDHDGRATEFLLQVGAGPCGHRQMVLVGVSRTNPKLHVFGTVAHPDVPLVLERPDSWTQFLRSKGTTTVVSWPCGDHGSEEEGDVELVAEAKGIRAYRLRYSCGDAGRGRLMEREQNNDVSEGVVGSNHSFPNQVISFPGLISPFPSDYVLKERGV